MKATFILLTLSVTSLIWNAIVSCPLGSFIDKYSNTCFWKIDQIADTLTCYNLCISKGGNLAEINNSFTYNYLMSNMGLTECLWIAVTDTVSEAHFKTFSGNIQTFLPWDVGEPDNFFYPEQNCVFMSHLSSPVGLWRDEYCFYRRCHCLCSNVTYDIDSTTYNKLLEKSTQSFMADGEAGMVRYSMPVLETTTTTSQPTEFYYIRKTDSSCNINNSTAITSDQSFLDCAKLCSSNQDCVAFSFQEIVSKCYFHQDEFCSISNSDDVISYVKRFL